MKAAGVVPMGWFRCVLMNRNDSQVRLSRYYCFSLSLFLSPSFVWICAQNEIILNYWLLAVDTLHIELQYVYMFWFGLFIFLVPHWPNKQLWDMQMASANEPVLLLVATTANILNYIPHRRRPHCIFPSSLWQVWQGNKARRNAAEGNS